MKEILIRIAVLVSLAFSIIAMGFKDIQWATLCMTYAILLKIHQNRDKT